MPDADHWTTYNERQAGRDVRPLFTEAIGHAGPGDGRVAIDVGCGAGIEVERLLSLGWTVHALDGDEQSLRRLDAAHPDARLHTSLIDLDHLPGLPTVDLLYSGYALPFIRPDRFADAWRRLRDALAPGGILAVNLFGDHDSWAGDGDGTFLTETEARVLVDGLELLHFGVEDADGMAFSGPKHWHVFDIVARRPAAP